MNEGSGVESLILLVGSNPLPNYLAAMALKPSKIHLVYSEETKGPKDRMCAALSAELGSNVTIDGDAFVDDPFSASGVGSRIRDLIAKCNTAHLHYTGGTKVMSAHALKAFYEEKGRPENASYLDEAQACLRFDDGSSRSLSDCRVTLRLDRILQLHGVTHKTRSRVDGGPGETDVQNIATAVLKRPQLASCLYGERKRLEGGNFNEAKEMPCVVSDYGVGLSVSEIPPMDGMNKRCFEAWYKFIGGEWLEHWVADRIEDIKLPGAPQIVSGVNCTRAESLRPFEVDVAVIRGQRAYLISCTTDTTRDRCKSKAFEILVRARHMAGDLARSALVSLLSSSTVTELQEDVADAWGSANPTRIFGLEDMKAWAGHNGSPNLGELKNWLDS